MKTRFVAFEDAGCRPYGYPQRPGLLIVHVSTSRDNCPAYVWNWIGERETTKTGLKHRIQADIPGFLAMVERVYGRKFTAVRVD